ncbi:hypothetical protein [Dokdonella sp.]|uniref:hypothetical protein n=1 Tax=Dokdonella sp. TaxID=2291710 RepID=UPI003529C776
MGPFRAYDLAGATISAGPSAAPLCRETRHGLFGRRRTYPEVGRFGQKTGKGWYDYKRPATSTAYPLSDEVAAILEKKRVTWA